MEIRSCIGDWELDTIIDKGQSVVLVSMVLRKSRLTLLAKVPDKQVQAGRKASLDLPGPLADRVHTLTAHNGNEFAHH